MSIQSTVHIKREDAIARISLICELVWKHDYRALEECIFEDKEDLVKFVDDGIDFKREFIGLWTNEMLENTIDKPFFRYSMFENYTVYY